MATAEHPDSEIGWPNGDPGEAELARSLDGEITAAAKALFLAGDLVRPGPGLFPFGAKARNRKTRRREVDKIAAARRAVLAELVMTRRNARFDVAHLASNRRRPVMVAAILTAIVIAVGVVGWWMSSTTPGASTGDQGDMRAAPTNPVIADTDSATFIIAGGSRPASGQVTAEPFSPAEVASAWLAAWCSTDQQQNNDVPDDAIRNLMTAPGWQNSAQPPDKQQQA